jgi:hypothetical protein
MPLGRVADDGNGALFFAHVEFDEPGPFSHVNGPDDVSAEEAVAWARRHAERVIVRVGDTHYSAGEQPVDGLEPWPLGLWRAVASTGWYRSDRSDVVRALASNVEKNQRARDVASGVDDVGFEVAFTVAAASAVEANEVAAEIVREAWAAAGIDAVPGDDFDAAGVSVTRV